MATAKANMVEKTRIVKETYTEKDGVILELNKAEAEMLAALLGFQTFGTSKHVMNIYKALKHEVAVYGPGVTSAHAKMRGSVTVED